MTRTLPATDRAAAIESLARFLAMVHAALSRV